MRVFGGALENERGDVERTRGNKKYPQMKLVTRGLKNPDADLRIECQVRSRDAYLHMYMWIAHPALCVS